MDYALLQYIFSGLGLFLNSFLIFCVFWKNPETMRCCSVVICVKAITDILAGIVSGYLMERFLSTGDTILIISKCNASHIHCYNLHILFLSFLQYNLIWIVISYLFRYYILHYRNPTVSKVVFTAVACFLPLLIYNFIWINMNAEHKTNRAPRIFSRPGDTVLAGFVVQISSFVIIGILAFSAVIVFMFYLIIRFSLVSFLEKNTARLSKNTFVYHRKLLKTVHTQAAIPVSIFSGSLIFFSMHFGILNPIEVQYLPILLFVFTTVISPISYFISLPPQWNFCFGVPKKFRNKNKKENSNTVTNNNAIQPISLAVSIF